MKATGDIAVVGMACRLPGARNYREFWTELIAGRVHTGRLPAGRIREQHREDELRGVSRDCLQWGGCIDDVHRFDADFFGFGDAEATHMDPMQKLLIESTYHCLEDAGYAPRGVAGTLTGVFLGATNLDFKEVKESEKARNNAFTGVGSAMCFLAGRLSHLYGWKGPSLVIDTACSSSGVAIHYAMAALRDRECDMAVCGGANYIGTLTRHIETGRLGLLSATGRCSSFRADADGYVRSEGVALILLKRLEDAISDGDNIHGVIKGAVVTHGGRGKSLITPSPFTLAEGMRRVLARPGIDARRIGYIEAQAVGHPDTDALELIALKRALRPAETGQDEQAAGSDKRLPCYVGSYKPTFGHVEAFSGTVAVIKSLLTLKHKRIPALAGQGPVNARVTKHLGSLRLALDEVEFPAPRDADGRDAPRLVAINNFGLSNTNVFMVLEEFTELRHERGLPRVDVGAPVAPVPIVLSAPSLAELRTVALAVADELVAMAGAGATSVTVASLAKTLVHGRDVHAHRLGFVAGTVSEVVTTLKRFASGASDAGVSAGVANVQVSFLGEAAPTDKTAECLPGSNLMDCVRAWVGGAQIDWRAHVDLRGPSIALPGRPFGGIERRFGASLPRPPEPPKVDATAPPLKCYALDYASLAAVPGPVPIGTWVLYGSTDDWDREFRTRHGQGDLSFMSVRRSEVGPRRSAANAAAFDFDDIEEVKAWLDALSPDEAINIVFLPGLARREPGEQDTEGQLGTWLRPLLSLLKALAGRRQLQSRLVVPYLASDSANADRDLLIGLALSVGREVPHVQLRPLRLETDESPRDRIVDEFRFIAGPPAAVAISSQGTRTQLRLLPMVLEAQSAPVRSKRERIWLLVGGLGGIGRIIGEHLLRTGQGALIVLGSKPAQEEQHQVLETWRDRYGAVVEYHAVDVGDDRAVAELATKLRAAGRMPTAVVHLAGSKRDRFILEKPWSEFLATLRPKVSGTKNLWNHFGGEAEHFALFSSIASVTGNFGQSDYAAANAFLNGFARRHAGQSSARVVSVCWPYWAEGGMKVSAAAVEYMEKEYGFRPLSNERAIAYFDAVLAAANGTVVVFEGDESRYESRLRSEGLLQASAAEVARPASRAVALDLSGLMQKIRHIVANALAVSPDELDDRQHLATYGVGSLTMMSILTELEKAFSVTVDPFLIAESGTIERIATELLPLIDAVAPALQLPVSAPPIEAAPARPEPQRRAVVEQEKVAIIGMAGRFPQSANTSELWQHLSAGRELLTAMPSERAEINRYCSQSPASAHLSRHCRGGFIDGIEQFDPGFFAMSVQEAITMDFVQRIILEVTQHLLDQSGYDGKELGGSATGVFIGGGGTPFMRENLDDFDARECKHYVVGQIQNMLSARISQFWDLKGPSYLVNTACSASLVAIHQACSSILAGESDLAIAGGSFLPLHPTVYAGFQKSGVISPDGRAYVFDRRANGIVLGEAVGLVLLKKLSRAVEDGDQILGVVAGSAVNNDGRTMGITTPNMHAQREVIEAALRISRVDPAEITYYEAHGTGTLLGDPIEIKAAADAYRRYTNKQGYCAVGAVKSNVGHSLAGAGVTGVIKILSAFAHKQIPPTINCEEPHDRFNFGKSPFYPNTRLSPWIPARDKRIAAISSFGFGGTNVHMILEEFQPPPEFRARRQSKPLTEWQRIPLVPRGAPASIDRRPARLLRYGHGEPYLRDHTVRTEQVLMGVTYLSALIDHCHDEGLERQGEVRMQDLLFTQLIRVRGGESVVLEPRHAGGKLTVAFVKGAESGDVASGTLMAPMDALPEERASEVMAKCASELRPGEELYARIRAREIVHGPTLATLQGYRLDGAMVYGRLVLSPEMTTAEQQYRIHPAFFDGALVAALAAAKGVASGVGSPGTELEFAL